MQVGVWKQIFGEWDFAARFIVLDIRILFSFVLEYKFILLDKDILRKSSFIEELFIYFFIRIFHSADLLLILIETGCI